MNREKELWIDATYKKISIFFEKIRTVASVLYELSGFALSFWGIKEFVDKNVFFGLCYIGAGVILYAGAQMVKNVELPALNGIKKPTRLDSVFIVLALVGIALAVVRFPWDTIKYAQLSFINDEFKLNSVLGSLGDYFGGVLGPILSFFTIMIIVIHNKESSRREDARDDRQTNLKLETEKFQNEIFKREDSRDWANKFESEVLAAHTAIKVINQKYYNGRDIFIYLETEASLDEDTIKTMNNIARGLISATYIINSLYFQSLKSVVSNEQNDKSAFHYYCLRSHFDEMFIKDLCRAIDKLRELYGISLPFSDKTLRALRKEQGAGEVFPDVTNLAAIQRIVDAAK